MSKIARVAVHAITNLRPYVYKHVEELADGVRGKKILELGSGKQVNGKYYYSAKHLFDESNDFLQSDVNKEFGHPIIDVTKMKYKNEFDIILCLNVLEHVFEFQKAIKNMHDALKPKGTLVVAVPMFYPLHDEPGDYWRFTEHALRKLFSDFKDVKLSHRGKREYPFAYYLEAKK
jgi:SAM-dependent methyltransferase